MSGFIKECLHVTATRVRDRFAPWFRTDRRRSIPDAEKQPARSHRLALLGHARVARGAFECHRLVGAYPSQEEKREVRDALRSMGAWQGRGRGALSDLYVPLARRRGIVVPDSSLPGRAHDGGACAGQRAREGRRPLLFHLALVKRANLIRSARDIL